ncbi:uncharacterized protein LOC123307834 isoform X1 [Coccinella septempunctata]|uniref:uncharacterized protein LOC123307834 isoform X1 n=1 Tax=Coccinella septempunctata TaxID=41139 RepID=UPI001D082052|nr:uncharacterized protein LOC123307834 isoform X1 [Coccinella septempunctata]
MAERKCLICGASESEVQRLFCFPYNPARNELWMQTLGFKACAVRKHHRICNNHFRREAFTDSSLQKLNRNAIPMPWVISSSAANTLESMPSLINEEHAGTSGISTFPASVLADEVEPNTDEEHAAVSSTSTFPSSVPANEGKASVTEEIHAGTSISLSGQLDSEAVATANFITEVDMLFDSFNGKAAVGPFGKELRGPLKLGSPHIKFWKEEHEKVQNWQFMRYTKNGRIRKSMPPSQTGWLQSINAIQMIWKYLRNNGFISLRTRSLNQDPLENLFGQIRYGCGSNDNPTVQQFIGTLKTQLLNGLVNQSFQGRNCEDDENTLLCNLKSFLNISLEREEMEVPEDASLTDQIPQFQTSPEELSVNISREVSSGNPGVFSVAYVAGAIVKTLKKHICCALCDNMISSSSSEPQNLFIANKEWSDGRSVLMYPSERYFVAVGCGFNRLEEFLDNSPSHPKVAATALGVLRSDINFEDLGCPDHKNRIRDITTAAICRIGIPWWCKRKCEEVKSDAKKKAYEKKIKKLRHS